MPILLALAKKESLLINDEPEELNRLARNIGYDLREPCADCPFLKSTPVERKGIQDLPGLMTSLYSDGEIAHSCHKTDPRSDAPDPKLVNGKIQHCVGFIKFAANNDRVTWRMSMAVHDGSMPKEMLQPDDRIHNATDLLQAYCDDLGIERKIAGPAKIKEYLTVEQFHCSINDGY